MDILHFPEVQIHGNNAIVREESGYVHLGEYDTSGVFVWSPDGEKRVAALQPAHIPNTVPLEDLIAEMEAIPEMKAAMDEARKTVTLEGLTVTELPVLEDKLEAELAAHRAKKAAAKPARRGR